MARARSYSDEDLAAVIASSRSWRGVLRALGLTATSSAQMRSVRVRADVLGLDYAHFTGQRRWNDRELADAVRMSTSYAEVADRLGLAGGSSTTTIKGHVVRLGLDTSQFSSTSAGVSDTSLRADIAHLSGAGSLLAAAWFALRGCAVSWPMEPARYDLVVGWADSLHRVQVKTSSYKRNGSWIVRLSTAGRTRLTYDPDEVDYFMVISGNLEFYLIPSSAVGGLQDLRLTAYEGFRMGGLGGELFS